MPCFWWQRFKYDVRFSHENCHNYDSSDQLQWILNYLITASTSKYLRKQLHFWDVFVMRWANQSHIGQGKSLSFLSISMTNNCFSRIARLLIIRRPTSHVFIFDSIFFHLPLSMSKKTFPLRYSLLFLSIRCCFSLWSNVFSAQVDRLVCWQLY